MSQLSPSLKKSEKVSEAALAKEITLAEPQFLDPIPG